MRLGIVVPCYNEAAVIGETVARLSNLLDRLVAAGRVARDSGICCVDDGSEDETWRLIEGLNERDPRVTGIKLSRNHGHQNALLAGLFTAPGDALVSVDADLQDDVEVIESMVAAYHEGYEIVYGVRRRRDSDTRFKKLTAVAYYKLLAAIGVDAVHNHADFRLMGRDAIESLKQFREVNLFLRGLVPLIGYRSRIVYYDRRARAAGGSKYPLPRMVGFALDGITSFSSLPLRLITLLGVVVFLLSNVLGLWAFGVRLWNDEAVPGWASTVLPVYFLGGLQLLSIGVIGEYLGKVYMEVKGRPRYIIEKVV